MKRIITLFENLVVNMFRANIDYYEKSYKLYFWRNYIHSEVDLVLVSEGESELIPIEIKWQKAKLPPKSFMNAYGEITPAAFSVTSENLWMSA